MGASAAISYIHTYDMGEAGSLGANNRPQDGTGSANYGGGTGGTLTLTGSAPNSTAHLSYNGTTHGNWGANFSGMVTNNFAVELWTRTSAPTQATVDIFQTGANTTNSLKITQIGTGNWGASYHGTAWVGAANGTGQPISANTWTHLALIRSADTTTFYIDGVAQAGTSGTTPTHNASAHLAVTSGGANRYQGDIDEINIFTFDPNTDDPVAALSVNLVPEPSSTALLGLGGLALILRRRK
jgi:hypothetical protein